MSFQTFLITNQCPSPLMLRGRILLRRGVLDTTVWVEVCQWLMASRWFSPGTPVSSTNKTDRHDITEILLKVALNTITLNPNTLITCINKFLCTLLSLHVKHNFINSTGNCLLVFQVSFAYSVVHFNMDLVPFVP
jgi:hypothetical protein